MNAMTHSSVLRGNSLMVVVKAMFIVAIATSWLGVHGQVNGSVAYSIYREGLIQIQITRLCEDSRGRIWVGTKDGICIYSPETHTFESRLTNSKLQTGVVNGIENDRHGKLWYLTIRGLYSEDGDSIQLPGFTKAIPPIKFCFDHKNRLWYVHFRSGKAFCLIGDRQIGLDALFPKLKQQHFSHVWFHAGSGHIVLRTNKKEFFYLDEKQQQVHPIPKDSLTVFRVSDRQEIYAFSSKGMYRIVPGGTPEFVMPLPGEDWKEIVQADMDTDGNCYFTRQNRLFQIREGKQFDYGTPFKLTTDVLVSKKGAIYVGTEEGLVVYHVPTFHYWDERDRVFDAYCMVRDKKGILWYQALGYGLYRFDSATAAFVEDSSYFHLFDRVDRGRDLRYNFYLGSTQAQDGNLLLAHGKGIMVKEGGNFRFLNDAADGGDLTVLDILEDTAHHRIFAASHALLEFDKAGNYHPLKEEAKQFNRRYFLALEVGPNGTIWAGETAQLGLVKGDSIVVVNHGGGGFPIHYDHRRLLWTGGKEGVGLWVLDPERHCSIRIAPSFLNRKMAFIEKIDESFLMVGTASGLFLLRLDEFYRSGRIFLAHYNQHNGLMGRECGQNSAFKDQNGEFLFATDNAIMRFDPAQLKKELGYPFDTTSIHVIDAQEISTGTSLEEGVENFHRFRFDQNQYKFQFSCDDGGHFVLHYILTQLGNPQKVQQVGVSANGEINLTGLTKGKYHLSVIPDLTWSQTGARKRNELEI
jgi:ligand-binding sensor domain-containing protein